MEPINVKHKKEEKKIPNLRFPGFEGEWNIKKLGKYCKFQQGVQVDVEFQKREPCQGYVRFLRIENYTQNSNDFRYIPVALAGNKSISKDEIAVVRYGATAGYIGRGFEGVLANNLFKVIPDQQILANNFLFEHLNSHKAFRFFQSEMIGGAMPALSFSIVKVLKVPITSLPEQQKIASFLSAVGKKIQQLTRKKELLEQYKKGVMQKIFSREIRFKQEDGSDFPDWEEKRLGDVTKLFSIRNKDLIDAPIYSVTNYDGFVLQSEHFDREVASEDLKAYKIVRKGEFAYNPARINVGSIAYFEGKVSVISSLYVCFKTTEDLDDKFLWYTLQLSRSKHYIKTYGEGGVRIYLWYPLFASIKISVPSIQEQSKIASFLSQLNQKINQVNNEIDQTQQFKKGLLQQMFV